MQNYLIRLKVTKSGGREKIRRKMRGRWVGGDYKMRKESRKSKQRGEKKKKGEIRQAESKIPQEFFFLCLQNKIKISPSKATFLECIISIWPPPLQVHFLCIKDDITFMISYVNSMFSNLASSCIGSILIIIVLWKGENVLLLLCSKCMEEENKSRSGTLLFWKRSPDEWSSNT